MPSCLKFTDSLFEKVGSSLIITFHNSQFTRCSLLTDVISAIKIKVKFDSIEAIEEKWKVSCAQKTQASQVYTQRQDSREPTSVSESTLIDNVRSLWK